MSDDYNVPTSLQVILKPGLLPRKSGGRKSPCGIQEERALMPYKSAGEANISYTVLFINTSFWMSSTSARQHLLFWEFFQYATDLQCRAESYLSKVTYTDTCELSTCRTELRHSRMSN